MSGVFGARHLKQPMGDEVGCTFGFLVHAFYASVFFSFLFFPHFALAKSDLNPRFVLSMLVLLLFPLCIILSSFRIFILRSEACLYIFMAPLSLSFFLSPSGQPLLLFSPLSCP